MKPHSTLLIFLCFLVLSCTKQKHKYYYFIKNNTSTNNLSVDYAIKPGAGQDPEMIEGFPVLGDFSASLHTILKQESSKINNFESANDSLSAFAVLRLILNDTTVCTKNIFDPSLWKYTKTDRNNAYYTLTVTDTLFTNP